MSGYGNGRYDRGYGQDRGYNYGQDRGRNYGNNYQGGGGGGGYYGAEQYQQQGRRPLPHQQPQVGTK